MELLPREKDKLLVFTAALLAERRLNRGLKAELSRSDGIYHVWRSLKAHGMEKPWLS